MMKGLFRVITLEFSVWIRTLTVENKLTIFLFAGIEFAFCENKRIVSNTEQNICFILIELSKTIQRMEMERNQLLNGKIYCIYRLYLSDLHERWTCS